MRHVSRAEAGEVERRILGRIVDLAVGDPGAEHVDQPGRRRIGGQPDRELVLGRRRHGGPGLAVHHHRGRLRRGAQRGVEHDIERVLHWVVARRIERPQAGRQRRILARLRPELAEQALRILRRIEAEAAIERARRRAVGIDVPAPGAADRLKALEHGEKEAGDVGHGFSPPKEPADSARIACNSTSTVLHRVYREIHLPSFA